MQFEYSQQDSRAKTTGWAPPRFMLSTLRGQFPNTPPSHTPPRHSRADTPSTLTFEAWGTHLCPACFAATSIPPHHLRPPRRKDPAQGRWCRGDARPPPPYFPIPTASPESRVSGREQLPSAPHLHESNRGCGTFDIQQDHGDLGGNREHDHLPTARARLCTAGARQAPCRATVQQGPRGRDGAEPTGSLRPLAASAAEAGTLASSEVWCSARENKRGTGWGRNWGTGTGECAGEQGPGWRVECKCPSPRGLHYTPPAAPRL